MDKLNLALRGREITPIQSIFCRLLGLFLVLTGFGHLSVLRQEFLAQVPLWLPIVGDLVVVMSGVVEIILGMGLIVAPGRYRVIVGWCTAAWQAWRKQKLERLSGVRITTIK